MSVSDLWETPWQVVTALARRYCSGLFDLDVCAEAHNSKANRFFSEQDNGLAQTWDAASVWCNPPYSNIPPWIEKAILETREGRTSVVVMLLPARTDTWFHRLRELEAEGRAHLVFTRGRIQFIPPPGVKASTNNAGNLVAAIFPPLDVRRGR